jgi:uroporphyrin-III C-methyltransferase/precorrin-2 dehydrogenase/sirohydrochlorin ferrochelatase
MFPVALSLEGRRCLVVGGGAIALRKVLSLVEERASITVVAPSLVPELEALAATRRIAAEQRPYRTGEAACGYAIVFAATDRRDVNRQVFEEGTAAGVFVNVADDPELCSFHLPARVRRGALELTVASGGGAPFLVRRLRQVFERRLGAEWTAWGAAAAAFRTAVRAQHLDPEDQEACFDRFFAATFDAERLTVRVPAAAEANAWLRAPDASDCAQRVLPRPIDRAPGFVSLVGAGPGCAGLVTVRGRERLMAADAVVFDRLAAGALPTTLPDRVELHAVGKEAGHHPVPQEQINELLVRLAGEGKRVVRFKGGDPYIFGRGGEEAEALVGAGIPFEVVPGITAGIAATAFAGIPVTHRREAVQVTLLTAHECAKDGGPQVRWDLLARDPHATLVGYMGVSALPGIVERLLADGMSAGTPAAMVESGGTSAQRAVISTLSQLPGAVKAAGLGAPALFVIGRVVRHAERLNWTVRRPLAGERLAVPAEAFEFGDALEEAGAEVVQVPLPITPAARIVFGVRPLTGCLARSAAEVEAFDEECAGPGWDANWTAWCLSIDAAKRARARGWRRIELVAGARPADLLARLAGEERRRAL